MLIVPEDLPFTADFLFAQRCLEGEVGAIRQFQEKYRPIATAYLRQKGATEGEAEEIAFELCADLMAERDARRPRLATYCGKASLKTWLYPFALNRLIARKRRQEVRDRFEQSGLDLGRIEEVSPENHSPVDSEAPLIELMRQAVEAGFRECPAEDFVLLQLAHSDRVHLTELARMFDCSKSKIDRDLDLAGKRVAEATLRYVREVDPWLELQWEDFIELCHVANPACFGNEEDAGF